MSKTFADLYKATKPRDGDGDGKVNEGGAAALAGATAGSAVAGVAGGRFAVSQTASRHERARRSFFRQQMATHRQAKADGKVRVYRGAPVEDSRPQPRGKFGGVYVADGKGVARGYAAGGGALNRYYLDPGKSIDLADRSDSGLKQAALFAATSSKYPQTRRSYRRLARKALAGRPGSKVDLEILASDQARQVDGDHAKRLRRLGVDSVRYNVRGTNLDPRAAVADFARVVVDPSKLEFVGSSRESSAAPVSARIGRLASKVVRQMGKFVTFDALYKREPVDRDGDGYVYDGTKKQRRVTGRDLALIGGGAAVAGGAAYLLGGGGRGAGRAIGRVATEAGGAVRSAGRKAARSFSDFMDNAKGRKAAPASSVDEAVEEAASAPERTAQEKIVRRGTSRKGYAKEVGKTSADEDEIIGAIRAGRSLKNLKRGREWSQTAADRAIAKMRASGIKPGGDVSTIDLGRAIVHFDFESNVRDLTPEKAAKKLRSLISLRGADYARDPKLVELDRYRASIYPIIPAERVSILSQIDAAARQVSVKVEDLGPLFDAPPKITRPPVSVIDSKDASVRLTDFLESDAIAKAEAPVAIGRAEDGRDIVFDLASPKNPHILIGGTSGSGKSVTMNSMIASLVQKGPDEVRFLMVDPKTSLNAAFGKLPHLIRPIAKNAEDAVPALDMAQAENLRRIQLLQEAGVDDIQAYAKKTGKKIPRLVVVIDEFEDIMSSPQKKAFEDLVGRIGKTGRSQGVHLILATQNPSASTFTSPIKGAMTAKVHLRAADRGQSRAMVGSEKATLLRGDGDALIESADEKLTRAQTPFADTDSLKEYVSRMRGVEKVVLFGDLLKRQPRDADGDGKVFDGTPQERATAQYTGRGEMAGSAFGLSAGYEVAAQAGKRLDGLRPIPKRMARAGLVLSVPGALYAGGARAGAEVDRRVLNDRHVETARKERGGKAPERKAKGPLEGAGTLAGSVLAAIPTAEIIGEKITRRRFAAPAAVVGAGLAGAAGGFIGRKIGETADQKLATRAEKATTFADLYKATKPRDGDGDGKVNEGKSGFASTVGLAAGGALGAAAAEYGGSELGTQAFESAVNRRKGRISPQGGMVRRGLRFVNQKVRPRSKTAGRIAGRMLVNTRRLAPWQIRVPAGIAGSLLGAGAATAAASSLGAKRDEGAEQKKGLWENVGGMAGGAVGSIVGGVAGTAAAPGLGTFAGGAAGGVSGESLGSRIGRYFDRRNQKSAPSDLEKMEAAILRRVSLLKSAQRDPIDRDGDGLVFDDTPDERPVPRAEPDAPPSPVRDTPDGAIRRTLSTAKRHLDEGTAGRAAKVVARRSARNMKHYFVGTEKMAPKERALRFVERGVGFAMDIGDVVGGPGSLDAPGVKEGIQGLMLNAKDTLDYLASGGKVKDLLKLILKKLSQGDLRKVEEEDEDVLTMILNALPEEEKERFLLAALSALTGDISDEDAQYLVGVVEEALPEDGAEDGAGQDGLAAEDHIEQ